MVDAPLQIVFAPAIVTVGLANDGDKLPVTTAPGATQLEVDPDNAKLVRVPLLEFPLASVKVVTVGFAAEATP